MNQAKFIVFFSRPYLFSLFFALVVFSFRLLCLFRCLRRPHKFYYLAYYVFCHRFLDSSITFIYNASPTRMIPIVGSDRIPDGIWWDIIMILIKPMIFHWIPGNGSIVGSNQPESKQIRCWNLTESDTSIQPLSRWQKAYSFAIKKIDFFLRI